MKKSFFFCLICLFVLSLSPAHALESYSPAQQEQFTSWCTGTKSNSEPVCNCALKQVMQTVAPVTLTSFLSNGGTVSFSQTSITAAAAVTQALSACSK
jgi:hypothetical protein